MKTFINENFLLKSEAARILYHEYAKDMPIVDYHNHLIPSQIANNASFENITQIWLYGDHYKWRAMRTNGVDERFCTGKDTTDWEKFEKWAETVPYTLFENIKSTDSYQVKYSKEVVKRILSNNEKYGFNNR